MKAIIVGGGVGGLTTALMLHARGIDCEIFEQTDQIRELGVGINTLPHAIKELAQLGLLDRLDAVGDPHLRADLLQPAGPGNLARAARHRCRLRFSTILDPSRPAAGRDLRAVRARLGESRIHTGHRLGSFTQDETGVTAYFFDRNGSHIRTARGDILIGADGIHSFVRAQLFPQEEPARFTGTVLWRGALDWPKFLTGRSMVIAGGMAGKLVLYPIAEGSRENRCLMNWAVMVKVGEGGGTPRKEDWSRPGRFEDLMPHVKRIDVPYCDAKALIEATPEFWEYPLCDRDPLAALVAWPRHAARRCRASDVSGRLQWRLAGDPRCALPRRPAGR